MLSALNNKWPDPSQSTSEAEFFKQYTELFGRMSAYKEIFMMLENAGTMAQNLAKQINNPKKDYTLGTKEESDKK